MAEGFTIRRVSAEEASSRVDSLAELLIDCVHAGASVGFLAPLSRVKAGAFWRRVADGVAQGDRVLIVAEEGHQLVGTVQLFLALPENQPHRADLAKMLVHSRTRRRGIAAELLAAAEREARNEGRTLIVLDAVTGGAAARLYERSGWVRVGDVPGFALMPDGAPCSTTYFYKDLSQ